MIILLWKKYPRKQCLAGRECRLEEQACGRGKGRLRALEMDFPGGEVVKNLPANAGDTDSSPGPGRSHMPRSN